MTKPRVPLTPPPTTPALVRRGVALALAGLAVGCGPAPTEPSAPTGPNSTAVVDPRSPQPAYPPTPQPYPYQPGAQPPPQPGSFPMTPQGYPVTPQPYPYSPQAYPPSPQARPPSSQTPQGTPPQLPPPPT